MPALVVVLAAVGLGCAGRPWSNPPAELLGVPWQNVSQPTPDTCPDPKQSLAAGLDAAFGNNPAPTPPPAQLNGPPLNVLAISAGGKFGSFSAGVMNGWTASGTRPQFDVVTGVSAGALLSIYAFLGPEYDRRAEEAFVEVRTRDLFRFRPVLGPVLTGAITSTGPFRKRIEREVDDQMIAEIARQHCAGRRLFIATGNRTTMRPAIWDVGAIAASGRPDAPKIIRKIILASASIPGFAPTVEFDVTVNGVRYRELHGDAGGTVQVFVRTANGLPPGSNVYVIFSGKSYRDPEARRPTALSAITTAASNALYALSRENALSIYALCAVRRSQFRMIATPQGLDVTPGSISFNREDQRRLFDAGYQEAASGRGWRSTPPGSQPDEIRIPRTGLDFIAPAPPQVAPGQ